MDTDRKGMDTDGAFLALQCGCKGVETVLWCMDSDRQTDPGQVHVLSCAFAAKNLCLIHAFLFVIFVPFDIKPFKWRSPWHQKSAALKSPDTAFSPGLWLVPGVQTLAPIGQEKTADTAVVSRLGGKQTDHRPPYYYPSSAKSMAWRTQLRFERHSGVNKYLRWVEP